MKLLVVVDMQNDFISGSLGTPEARAIVASVEDKISGYRAAGFPVIFTRDTHGDRYLESQEGKNLPVMHCVRGTAGWEITPQLSVADSPVVDKPSFGSSDLPRIVSGFGPLEEIELVGLCTDICVISNAIILKAFFPEVPLSVDAACCAGVSPQSHENALSAMRMCQISVKNGEA